MLTRYPHEALPRKPILSDLDQGYTAAQIETLCERLIAHMALHEITKLALYAGNGVGWVVVDLACKKAGICLLPLPTFFSTSQISHALTSCGISAIITDNPEPIEKSLQRRCQRVGKCILGTLALFRVPTGRAQVLMPSGTGKITFTSGSTGEPKGVCLSHRQLEHQARVIADAVAIESPRHLCVLPLSTLLENVAGVYAPLLAAGEVIVPAQEDLGFRGSTLVDQGKMLSVIHRVQPDSLILIPQLLLLLTSAIEAGWQVPKTLKFIAVGGSKVSPELITQARGLGLPVYEGYGLSECASVVSLNTPGADKPGSCGKPLQPCQVTLIDGEVIIAGNTMLGYVNEPTSWNPSVIASGDLGALDAEGFLSINGRKKNLLISSYGRNISPEWIESELLAKPFLQDAVVLGDAKPYCTALISPRSPQTPDSEVQNWLDAVNATLPDYARIKRWYRLEQSLSLDPNLMTENGRPRRENINRSFSAEISTLYNEAFFSET